MARGRVLPFALWALAAAATAAALLADLRPGATPGFGLSQTLLALVAFALCATGIELQRADVRAALLDRPLLSAERRTAFGRFALITLQLVLLALVIQSFRIENPAFYDAIIVLTAAGFVLHDVLPIRMRLSFFVALSFAGIYLVFGLASGAWLVGIGLILIGICHLPVPFALRVALLVSTGAGLGLFRAEIVPGPVPGAIWSILGSMFMFRLIVYMYDLRHAKEPFDWKRTLAYFFMLPNVVFPLFPVVDWTIFRRTYYDEDRYWIYQRGVQWMVRGVTHLLLYRVVDYYVALSPSAVLSAGDLVQFIVGTYLLYLRVSGQFHLIIGMLHLFGFRLPETHHLFYLTSSFTDFWRRINIYWKDFMMKVVYYPTFFALRRHGMMFGIVVATLAVFAATWALHAYQWFWLLGTVLLTWPDVLFWSILAVLMIVNTVLETKRGRTRTVSPAARTPARFARHAAQTLAFFVVISVLWSLWSSDGIGEWFRLWSVVGAAQQSAMNGATTPLLALTAMVALRLPDVIFRRRTRRPRSFTRTVWPTLAMLAVAVAIGLIAPEQPRDEEPAATDVMMSPTETAHRAVPVTGGSMSTTQPETAGILATVKAFILQEFLPDARPDELTETTPLVTGAILDSLATVRLVTFLEEQFAIEIRAHEASVEHLDTLKDIAELVRSKRSA